MGKVSPKWVCRGGRLKAFGRLILLIVLPPIIGISHSHAAATVVVTKAFNGREIKVRPGGTIRIELEQLGAAGYTWEVQNLDREHFQILSVRTANSKDKGDLVGSPVLKIWDVRAIRSGKSKLTFLHYRRWEGEKNAADTFILNVRILGAR